MTECKATMLLATEPEVKNVLAIAEDLINHDNIHRMFVQTDHYNDCDIIPILSEKNAPARGDLEYLEVLLN